MKSTCASLQLSRELERNGFIHETKFYWSIFKHVDEAGEWEIISEEQKRGEDEEEFVYCPAPNSDELLEKLPTGIYVVRCTDGAYLVGSSWSGRLMDEHSQKKRSLEIIDSILVCALARMWLYFKRTNLLKLSKEILIN